MSVLRVGLIGAGFVSRHHLLGWRSLAGQAEVVAIADPSAENAHRRAAEFAIPAIFQDAAAMLAAGGLDAVDIAAPREFHAPLVRLAAARGLPVLCQKPLAPTLAEAEALVAEVDGRIRLMIHENWRFRAYYRQIAAWLQAGGIGAPVEASFSLLGSGTLADSEGRYPALERQPFMRGERRMLVAEVLIHHLDTLRMLFGPMTVTAAELTGACPDMVGEDGAVIDLAAASGAKIKVIANLATPGAPPALVDRLQIRGERGTIRLDGPSLIQTGPAAAELSYDLAEVYQASYDAAIGDFVRRLRAGSPFETSPSDNLETLRLVEDCYRLSGWRGK